MPLPLVLGLKQDSFLNTFHLININIIHPRMLLLRINTLLIIQRVAEMGGKVVIKDSYAFHVSITYL